MTYSNTPLLVGKYLDHEFGCFRMYSPHFSLREMGLRKQYMLGNWNFISRNLESVVGYSSCGSYAMKIELKSCNKKQNTILEEYNIMSQLSNGALKTIPRLYSYQELSSTSTLLLKESLGATGGTDETAKLIIMERVSPSPTYNIKDIWNIAVIQQKYGIYHGDIKPSNIGIDSFGNTVFIDYDQAVYLDENERNLNKSEFFNWTCAFDKRFCITNKRGWLRHFNDFESSLLSFDS